LRDQIIDLIHSRAVCTAPIAPLSPIYATELTFLVSPLVPDRHPMLIEITNVGIAAEEPKELVNNGFDVQLFCREQREPRPVRAQIKPSLRSEN
jgi:hypothetical protein